MKDIRPFYYHLAVVWQIFKRDVYVFITHRWRRFAINYILFCPFVYAFAHGYIVPLSGMASPTPEAITIFFCGSILWILWPITYTQCIELFMDLHNDRYIDYQLTLLPGRWIIIERAAFISLISFIHILPYYPIARWLLGDMIVFEHVSWLLLGILLGVSSFFCTVFALFFIFYIEHLRQISNFFLRFVISMIQLGGVRTPYFAMAEYSSLLAVITLLNPIIYITEGLRQALLGQGQFLPLTLSIPILIFCSVGSLLLAFRLSRKRLDYI